MDGGMKRIVLITTSDASPGFSLAGIEQVVATQPSLPDLLVRNAHDEGVGLIVVDERLLSKETHDILKKLDRLKPGKITTLPSPKADEADMGLEIIRQAIGYHIRMQG